MKLLPVASRLFQLQQSIKGREEESSEEEEEPAATTSADYLLKRKLLAETFGSRKRQRMIRSQLANVVKLENGMVFNTCKGGDGSLARCLVEQQ